MTTVLCTLQCELSITHASSNNNDSFYIQAFGSQHGTKSVHLHHTVHFVPDTRQTFTLQLARYPSVPRFLHFRLFVAEHDTSLNLCVESQLCWGIVSLAQLLHAPRETYVRVLLTDTESTQQAILRVACISTEPSSLHLLFTNDNDEEWRLHRVPAFDARLESRVRELFTSLVRESGYTFERTDYFSYVRTDLGMLPISSYVDMTQHNHAYAPEQSRILFEHWITCTARRLGHTATSSSSLTSIFDALPRVAQLEWIGQTFTLLIQALLYKADVTRGANESRIPCDQWVRLLSFPHLERSSFDCEDGAGLVLDLIAIFKRTQFHAQSTAFAMQQIVHKYTACLALGTIQTYNSSEPYSAHAFPVLLDTRFVTQIHTTLRSYNTATVDLLPAIVLETTAHTDTVWTRETMMKHAPDVREITSMLSHTAGDSNQWFAVIKPHISIASIIRACMYGRVNALITADYPRRVVHWVAHTDAPTRKIGVQPEQLFTYDIANCTFALAADITNDDLQSLSLINIEMPSAVLPRVASSTTTRDVQIVHASAGSSSHQNTHEQWTYINAAYYREYSLSVHAALDTLMSSSSSSLVAYRIEQWHITSTVELIAVCILCA